MTHKDIFTKYMIEYDKANVTSSYPALTEYEIATVLDKAYMALISLKVTGNNVRRAPFEADVKSISDLLPLVVSYNTTLSPIINTNIKYTNLSNLAQESESILRSDLTNDLVIDIKFLEHVGQDVWKIAITTYCKYQLDNNSISVSITDNNDLNPSASYTIDIPTQNIPYIYGQTYINTFDLYDFDQYCTSVSNDNMFNSFTITIDDNCGYRGFDRKVIRIYDQTNTFRFSLDVDLWNENTIPECSSVILHNSSNEFLYFVEAYCKKDVTNPTVLNDDQTIISNPIDRISERLLPVNLTTHAIAQKFTSSTSNIPWIKNPLAYIEDNVLYVLLDPITQLDVEDIKITYIKTPNKFAKDLSSLLFTGFNNVSYFEWYKNGDATSMATNVTLEPYYQFELDDVVAEELISLAITYTLENVESPRLNAHLGIKGLES